MFLGNRLSAAAFGRYDHYLNEDYFGIGGDVRFRISDGVSLFGGASRSHRLPTYQELYWVDSTVARITPLADEEHTQLELGSEITLPWSGFLRAAVFERTIADPVLLLPFGSGSVFPGIQFTNGPEVTSKGVDFLVRFRPRHMMIEYTGTYLVQESGGITSDEYPLFAGTGGIYFWDKLFEGNLELKAGFRGRYQTSQLGSEFNPEVLAYVKNNHQEIQGGGTLDLVVIGKIGEAYVHFIWENLTEAQYFSTPFYPALDRSIRFGISWTFLD